MHSYLLCPRQRDARTQEKQMNRALYCHHFPLILPQSLFKTWHLPLTTGHYVSAVLHRGALLSIWKSIHIINHIKPAARNIYAASDPGSAFPVSLCVCALIQNQPSRVQQRDATGSDETMSWKCIQYSVCLSLQHCWPWRTTGTYWLFSIIKSL